MKKIGFYILSFFLILISILVINTVTWESKQMNIKPVPLVSISDSAKVHLSSAIRYMTVAEERGLIDTTVFTEFHNQLRKDFPLTHRYLKVENINHSLIYTWPGRDTSLKPILFLAHQDVVPARASEGWRYPPFSGKEANGFIFGRGTLDDKGSIIGIMEATEALLIEGYKPERSILLAFGQDEETGGNKGCQSIARKLEKKGIKIEYVLDEGGIIVKGSMPGLSRPLAVVGIAEKGYISIELSTSSVGGHSSMPPQYSPIGRLSEALIKLEKHPFPSSISGATAQLFDYAGPELNFGMKLAFANQWLLTPVIKSILEKNPSTNATIRTTTALTIFHAGSKDNVLPTTARAVINFRILPGETSLSVERYVAQMIDDTSVKIKVLPFSSEPSDISDTASSGFKTIHRTIRQIFPDVVVAPYLVLAATDSRHFRNLSTNIFRFLPVRLGKDDLSMIHGKDEKISFENLDNMIRFYRQLILNSSGDISHQQ